ncbi:hypothetical protein MLD38_012365 [Melastoma candidum]|uniref:Uncharacterized protein n=1 Tax=Melastoma candidum TaxID=119954 RepID=A0ACB9R6P3_9MYRT|nr:hypothetical protein MLD38_012365 [Melastoma candidum]
MSTSAPSASAKRSRDPEDEVYLDNLHSSKRYLSEIMASSLNGLTVGREETLSDSPARLDSMLYLRDELSSQYSPMSEDSDDSRFCEPPFSGCSSQSESLPTSPVSPYRCQKPSFSSLSAPASNGPTSPSPSNFMASSSSQPRQRGSDSEGRFPSSPSDICHSADLRRAALLRSVQMRTQPGVHPAYELSFGSGQEAVPNVEGEDIKSIANEKEYHEEECHSMGLPTDEYADEKYCDPLNSDSSSDGNGT